jgi:hypothetical protein
MNRIDFLRKIIIGSLAPSLLAIKPVTYTKHYLLQCFIRGFKFNKGPALINQLAIGDELELVREPDNKFDSACIALHWNGSKIGYIPQEENEYLSKFLDIGVPPMYAEITHLQITAASWEQVSMALYVLKICDDENIETSANQYTILSTPKYYSFRNKEGKITRIDKKKHWFTYIENNLDEKLLESTYKNLNPVAEYGRNGQYFLAKKEILDQLHIKASELEKLIDQNNEYFILKNEQLNHFATNISKVSELCINYEEKFILLA